MRRREFITLVGGAAVAWPLTTHAQPAMPLIGFLSSESEARFSQFVVAFRQGLGEAGYVEGRNIAIEFRWAEGRYDRLPGFAADLVHRQAAVIITSGGDAPALAAKAATQSIPIVVAAYGGDPIKLGLIASINRPGGNITVVSTLNDQITAKRLELLRELVPAVTVIGLLVSRGLPRTEVAIAQATEAGRHLGLQIVTLDGASEREIDEAFATAVQKRLGAILVEPTAIVMHQRAQLATLATRYAIPVLYPAREFAIAGGLVSYGANFTDGYRQAALYAGRILKGAKPAELPVLQPTKFDLVFNDKTARALGIQIPARLLALANEVIE